MEFYRNVGMFIIEFHLNVGRFIIVMNGRPTEGLRMERVALLETQVKVARLWPLLNMK